MSRHGWVLVSAATLLVSGMCLAQRGMGDRQGVVRQGVAAQVMRLRGEVTGVKTAPCENIAGGDIGTHFLLKTDAGEEYNIHLGPAEVVKDVAAVLTTGREVAVRVIRTEKMPQGHAVAVTIRLDGRLLRLRDEELRPVWAGRGPIAGDVPSMEPRRPLAWPGRGPCVMGRGLQWPAGPAVFGRAGRMGRGLGRGWGGGRGRCCMRQRFRR